MIGDTQRSISSIAVGSSATVVDQALLRAGVQQELLHPAARHVAGGLVATHEEQERFEDDLVLVEAITVDLGVHEDTHEIVGRLGSPRRDHALRVLEERAEALRSLLEPPGLVAQ